MKYQRKSPGRRDAHARVAGHLAAPLPADDARVLRRPRRPGAAGLRLGPGEREARELRGDVYVGVALYIYMYVCIYIHIVYMYTGLGG